MLNWQHKVNTGIFVRAFFKKLVYQYVNFMHMFFTAYVLSDFSDSLSGLEILEGFQS